MKTTLNEICKHKPSAPILKKWLSSLNKTEADDEPVSIVQILDSNGLDDALWCLRAVTGRDREIRHYMVWVARQVQHLMTDPLSLNALDVAERFADGLATQEELDAALATAVDAAAAWAEEDAVWSVAGTAVGAAAWAAVCAVCAVAGTAVVNAAESASAALCAVGGTAARDVARDAQEKKLRELCAWCEQN